MCIHSTNPRCLSRSGYSQTLPRNAHIMSLYGNLNGNTNTTKQQNQSQNPTANAVSGQPQRSVSPDLIQKTRPKDPIG